MSEQLCRCSGAPDCGATGCPTYIPHLTHGTDHSRERECLSTDGRLVRCELVQMMICPASDCPATCSLKEPHKRDTVCELYDSYDPDGGCPACVPVEQADPAPEMMICPNEKCPVRKRCPSGGEHRPDRSCPSGVSVCPACIPVGQADPEPPPITDGLRDELRKRDAQIVGYHSVIRDIAIATGESAETWRKLGGKAIVEAVRALALERDELRGRLAVMRAWYRISIGKGCQLCDGGYEQAGAPVFVHRAGCDAEVAK